MMTVRVEVDEPARVGVSTKRQPSSVGWCTRLGRECRGFFPKVDTNGREIDFLASFSFKPRPMTLLAKMVLTGFAISALVYGWVTSEYAWFYPAYLTHWGLIFSCIYLMLSTLISFGCMSMTLIKLAWLLFSLAAVFEVIITAMYWSLIYEGGRIVYDSIMAHAIVLALVLFDGLVINRTPVRLWHWIAPLFFSLGYVGWSIAHSYAVEDNPYKDEGEDDAIYEPMDWKNERTRVIILSLIVVFGVSPVAHLILWVASLHGRRYKPLVVIVPSPAARDVEAQVAAPAGGQSHGPKGKPIVEGKPNEEEEVESDGSSTSEEVYKENERNPKKEEPDEESKPFDEALSTKQPKETPEYEWDRARKGEA